FQVKLLDQEALDPWSDGVVRHKLFPWIVQKDGEFSTATMRRDPIVEGFETLARRAGDAALVAGPKRAATRADVLAAACALERELLGLAPARGAYALVACVNGAGF